MFLASAAPVLTYGDLWMAPYIAAGGHACVQNASP